MSSSSTDIEQAKKSTLESSQISFGTDADTEESLSSSEDTTSSVSSDNDDDFDKKETKLHETAKDGWWQTRGCLCKTVTLLGIFFFVTTVVLLIVLLVGSRIERGTANSAPATDYLYKANEVCALDDSSSSNVVLETFVTLDSAESANDLGFAVAHCGACGQCSTRQDMTIQGETRDSLTKDATACAWKSVFGSRSDVASCMQKRIGFTEPCQDCWLDNIECSKRHCKFTCALSLIFSRDNNKSDGSLNECLECDEKMCGPEFLTCSGSNRRRLGIRSAIERDDENEQCESLDIDWMNQS